MHDIPVGKLEFDRFGALEIAESFLPRHGKDQRSGAGIDQHAALDGSAFTGQVGDPGLYDDSSHWKADRWYDEGRVSAAGRPLVKPAAGSAVASRVRDTTPGRIAARSVPALTPRTTAPAPPPSSCRTKTIVGVSRPDVHIPGQVRATMLSCFVLRQPRPRHLTPRPFPVQSRASAPSMRMGAVVPPDPVSRASSAGQSGGSAVANSIRAGSAGTGTVRNTAIRRPTTALPARSPHRDRSRRPASQGRVP